MIDQLTQVQTLASPVRQEILDCIIACGRCSIAELAAQLGRKPDSLYYHVRKLVKVGLLVPRGTRRTEHRHEALYEANVHKPLVRLTRRDPVKAQAIKKLTAAMLRLTCRDVDQAIDSGKPLFDGSLRRAGAGRVKAWLDEDDLKEVAHLLEQLRTVLHRGNPPGTGQLYAVTYAFVPVKSRC